MFFLQVNNQHANVSIVLFFGTIGMLALTIGLIVFIIFHQRKVIRYQMTLQKMEHEQQKMLLNASIRLQEEERQRIAADLHDDAGPLLATARLYLNENLVNLDKTTQLQSIYNAKQIIDDTIQLIRNISHSLMPPPSKTLASNLQLMTNSRKSAAPVQLMRAAASTITGKDYKRIMS